MEDDLKKMEDDLKKKKMEDGLKKKWKTISKIDNGRQPKKIKMEDDLKKWKNERRPQKRKKKVFSQFLSILGATLSWGWLSSLRFLLFLIKERKNWASFSEILNINIYSYVKGASEIYLRV